MIDYDTLEIGRMIAEGVRIQIALLVYIAIYIDITFVLSYYYFVINVLQFKDVWFVEWTDQSLG